MCYRFGVSSLPTLYRTFIICPMERRAFVQWIGLSLVIAACRSVPLAPRRKWLALGDSITATPGAYHGEVTSYPEFLRDDFMVYNRGVSGISTNVLLRDFDAIAADVPACDIATLMIGTNDHRVDRADGIAVVPVDAFEENVTTLVGLMQQCAARVVLFTTPYLVSTYPTRYDVARLRLYNAVIQRVAMRADVGCVDVFAATQRDDAEWLLTTAHHDGIHPTTDVEKQIATLVRAHL